MALGPGALSLLLQPTHVNNPARGDGVFRAADQLESQRHNAWYRTQREKEFEEEKRRQAFDMAVRARQSDLDVDKFNFESGQVRRKQKAQAHDELLEAERSRDPARLRAAIYAAKQAGIAVTGWERRLLELEGEAGDEPNEDASDAPTVGDTIGEGDQAWEVVETPPEAKQEPPPEPIGGPPGLKGGLPSSVPSWLANEMQSRQEAPGQEQAPPDADLPPELLAPVESVDVPEAEPAPQKTPQGGIRGPLSPFTGLAPSPGEQGLQAPPQGMQMFDMDTGEPLGPLDYDSASSRARARVAERFQPIVEGGSDRERAAAQVAAAIAQAELGEGVGIEDAIERGWQYFHKTMGNATAKSVARGGTEEEGGRWGAPSIGEATNIDGIDIRFRDSTYKIISNLQAKYGTADLIAETGQLENLGASLDADFGFADKQSLRTLLLRTEGKRQTDKDLDYALKSAGGIEGLLNELENWTPGGGFSDGFKSQLRQYTDLLSAETERRRAKASREARAALARDPLIRKLPPDEQQLWLDQADGMVSGTWVPPRELSEREQGKRAKKKAKPKPGAKKRAQELLADDDDDS